MPQFFSRLVVDHNQEEFLNEPSLWHDHELALFGYSVTDEGQLLNALVFKVRRNPKNLVAHLRRIYFCYQARLTVQLYAALLDFLIVLQGRGRALSHRMVYGSRPQLNEQQFLALEAATDNRSNQGNRFSLFTSGLLGKCELVEYRQLPNEEKHDFLALANDFIEYSQLDQAMEVLEAGIRANPERQELQDALLELYKSTRNHGRFETLYNAFGASGVPLVDEWRTTAIFFEGLS